MKHSGKTIEARSARETVALLLQTWEFYFPPELRERYDRIAADFATRDQTHWIERAHANTPKIREALLQLGDWSDVPDSELLMSAWDDEVLFFYVLRTQFVVARLAARPDDMVPGHLNEFWTWAMSIRDDEPWMLFPVMTAEALKVTKTKPPIWKIPYPRDYPSQN